LQTIDDFRNARRAATSPMVGHCRRSAVDSSVVGRPSDWGRRSEAPPGLS
jgi:hypothetical protein